MQCATNMKHATIAHGYLPLLTSFNRVVLLTCCAFLLAVSIAFAPILKADKPERIVSMNVCTDQLLMLIADHSRISSVSHLAHQSENSAMWESARKFPANHGMAEEITSYRPDLIITSKFSRPQVSLLRKIGYSVLEIPIAETFSEIRANIRTVAEAVGETERGEQLIAEFDEAIKTSRNQRDRYTPLIALYFENGFTFGSNTLISEIIDQAGFRNLATELGISGGIRLPLEILVTHRPEALMITNRNYSPALANELPNHPAIRLYFSEVPKIGSSSNLWICGTPFAAEAISRLVKFRKTFFATPGDS